MTLLVRACRFWAVQTLVLVRQTCPTCKTFQVSVRVRPTTSALLPRTQEGLLLEECFLLQHLPLRHGRKGILILSFILNLLWMLFTSRFLENILLLVKIRQVGALTPTLFFGNQPILILGHKGVLILASINSKHILSFMPMVNMLRLVRMERAVTPTLLYGSLQILSHGLNETLIWLLEVRKLMISFTI